MRSSGKLGPPPAGRELHLGECKLVGVLIGSSWNGAAPLGNEIKAEGWSEGFSALVSLGAAGGLKPGCPW